MGMSDREFRLFIGGFLAMVVLWIFVLDWEYRWRLKGIYDELDRLGIVQSRCKFLGRWREAEAEREAAIPIRAGQGFARSFGEAEPIDVPWRHPDDRQTASGDEVA
jgi:hypothetical protein